MPSAARAEEIVRRFFTVTTNAFIVSKGRVVGNVVAAACGLKWSAKLQRIVNLVMQQRLGLAPVRINTTAYLWPRLMPRHFDMAEAMALSVKLRRRKRPPPEAMQ